MALELTSESTMMVEVVELMQMTEGGGGGGGLGRLVFIFMKRSLTAFGIIDLKKITMKRDKKTVLELGLHLGFTLQPRQRKQIFV